MDGLVVEVGRAARKRGFFAEVEWNAAAADRGAAAMRAVDRRFHATFGLTLT